MSATRSDQIIWLDALESDFDEAVRHLELVIHHPSLQQFSSILLKAKDKIRSIVAAFAQLIHKSQSVLQSNCKLEALLMDLRSQLVKQKAKSELLEKEVKARRLEVRSLELQLRNSENRDSDYSKELDALRAQMELEIENIVQDQHNQQEVHALAEQLEGENNMLHEYMEEAHADLSAAKLQARYMEKELAGRVQQLQLVGSGVSRERFDKLWSELNAEIEVQRHKAVIRTKKSTTNPFKAMRIPLPKKSSGNARQNLIIGRFPTSKAYSGILESCVRRVVLNKEKGSTLGMSITGGAEHGVPILVSDLQTGKPAHSCGLLRIGDAILSVNGHNLRNCHHKDAVTVLQSVGEEVVMEVAYIADLVSDNSDDEGEHHQQRQQPLITRDSSMPPQNEVDSLNSASSESEYDSPDSSVEPDHVTSVPTTLLPTSTLPVSSTSLPVTSNSLPVTSASIPASSASIPASSVSLPASSASVLCKPRRAGTQQHKLMASFGATPHNGLQDSRVMAHPDDLSDENSNFNNNSVSANGGATQYANYANYYTDNPYATVVSAIELGPSDIPKGKSKPARV